MPPYVRKQSLLERVKAQYNIYDWLLWLSEEISSSGWDQIEKEWALIIGVVLNLLFMFARANVNTRPKHYDDVFGEGSGSSWAAATAWFFTHILTLLCLLNTFYTFFRHRHYRLFENPVDVVPSTPSARRVKLNSSPVSSSPLRFLSSVLGTETAESRAHPDPKEDVWEIAVWDPLPISLRLFCMFSPGHIIMYWLFLPILPSDPRPGATIATTIFLAAILAVQMSYMSRCYSQQGKDSAFISKEVLHEYDTKFVRPRTQPLYRDVATQFSEQASYSQARDEKYNNVVTFTPTVNINRGFKTNPNPNYMHQNDPDSIAQTSGARPQVATPNFKSPLARNDLSSPMRPQTAIRQPTFRPSVGAGGGGSLGVYSHAASPLRKSASTNLAPAKSQYINNVNRSRGSLSPEKRRSTPASGLVSTDVATQRWGHLKSDKARRETGNF